jgi:thiol-disulfide isomerase/thioredoxin
LEQIKRVAQIQEDLTFLDEKGHKARLKQYQGMPVYLQVFQTDCINCIREMLIIKELQSKYNGRVQFVSLCTDPDKKSYQAFVKQYGKQFDWPVLYFDGQYDWLAQQGIETLPDHLFLDENSAIKMRYAPSPDNGLSEYLQIHFPMEEEQDENPLFQNRNKQ